MVVSARFSWLFTGAALTWYSDYSSVPYGKIYLGAPNQTFFVKSVRISLNCIVANSLIPVHDFIDRYVVNAQMVLKPIVISDPYVATQNGVEVGSLTADNYFVLPIGTGSQYVFDINNDIAGFDIAAWSIALNANSAANNIGRFFISIDWE